MSGFQLQLKSAEARRFQMAQLSTRHFPDWSKKKIGEMWQNENILVSGSVPNFFILPGTRLNFLGTKNSK